MTDMMGLGDNPNDDQYSTDYDVEGAMDDGTYGSKWQQRYASEKTVSGLRIASILFAGLQQCPHKNCILSAETPENNEWEHKLDLLGQAVTLRDQMPAHSRPHEEMSSSIERLLMDHVTRHKKAFIAHAGELEDIIKDTSLSPAERHIAAQPLAEALRFHRTVIDNMAAQHSNGVWGGVPKPSTEFDSQFNLQ